jgi:multisubunit Na+/H+ antiporter MnhB subunit
MQFAPLKSSFMVISILGFIISAVVVYDISPKFGFAFAMIFVLMFVASIISMTYAPVAEKEPKK